LYNSKKKIFKIIFNLMKILNFKIILLSLFTLSVLSMKAQTKVIAHRGFSGIAPENTLAAFQKAIESGAGYLELDVHKTADDSVVVIHDYTVERTCSNNMRGRIKQMTFDELRAVRVGYSKKFGEGFIHEKVPTLREALEFSKGKIKVCIEIKVHDVEKAVINLVNELNMRSEVIIFSFHYEVLTKVRQLDKKVKILYLKNNIDKKSVDAARHISAYAVGGGYKTTVTKDLLKYVHESNMELWRWTVNKEEEMQALVEVGVDGIITNYPDKALEIVSEKTN
jgi:glycerophosphoryl diester phosphodiesterase